MMLAGSVVKMPRVSMGAVAGRRRKASPGGFHAQGREGAASMLTEIQRYDSPERSLAMTAKRVFLSLALSCLIGAAFAPAARAEGGRWDRHQDRVDIRHDRGDIREDRREVRGDLWRGNRCEARRELRDIRHDRRDLRHDRRDLRRDRW
jgi:hypothetical protein